MLVVTRSNELGQVEILGERETVDLALALVDSDGWEETHDSLPPGVVVEWTQPGVTNLPTMRIIEVNSSDD